MCVSTLNLLHILDITVLLCYYDGMMKLKVDSERVQALMEANEIGGSVALAKQAGLHFRTAKAMLDGGGFKSNSLDKLAACLGVNPLELITAVDI